MIRLFRDERLVPGEIAVVRPAKQWMYAGNPYLSGAIESTRLDARALRLVPPRLEERGLWNPAERYWGEEGEPIEDWAKPIIVRDRSLRWSRCCRGRTLMIRFPTRLGNPMTVRTPLIERAHTSCRCIFATLIFVAWTPIRTLATSSSTTGPKTPFVTTRQGFESANYLSREGFHGVRPWGWIDNRPFLRCMNGFGLCLWRLGRFDEAGRVFDRMLWLNPSDHQGVRFLIDRVRARAPWEGSR